MMTVNTNWAMPARAQNQNGSLFLFAAHTGYMVYNVSMELYYNHLLKKADTREAQYTAEQIQTIKQERLKHTISGVFKGVGLIICCILIMQDCDK